MARVLIAGCGYVGSALGTQLVRENRPQLPSAPQSTERQHASDVNRDSPQPAHEVWGMRRNPVNLPEGVEPIAADLGANRGVPTLPEGLDWIFYLVSPSGSEDALYLRAYVEGLQGLLDALDEQQQKPKRLIFASSTAVYGQRNGEWIDEESETKPTHYAGRRLLEAEKIALDAAIPSCVVRFGGIYGPRRTQMVDRVRIGRATYREDPPQYTNRIHRDDCAGVLRHLVELDNPESVYLGVDGGGVPQRDVLNWIAGVLGAPEPRAVGADEAPVTKRGNKRCRNDRLIASGYEFRFPSFREGYGSVVEDEVKHGVF